MYFGSSSAKEISDTCSPASFNQSFFAAISFGSLCSLSSYSFRFFSLSLALSPLCETCSIFRFSTFFLWPKFKVGSQSTLYLSQLFAAPPETKCWLHTWSFGRMFSVKSTRLIAEIQRDRRSNDNFSASSPWFVTTDGTRTKWRCLSRALWLPLPTIMQKTIFTVKRDSVCLSTNMAAWRRLLSLWSCEWKQSIYKVKRGPRKQQRNV